MSTFSQCDLFGGALSIELPVGLLDASTIRQVPDTQEVFLSRDSDISYIVEILEAVNASNVDDAARLHFESLAHDNSAISSTLSASPALPSTPFSSLPASPPNQPTLVSVKGTQLVQKFGRGDPDQVTIFLALWRVPGKKSDVVFSINCPDASKIEWVEGVFAKASASFRVVDFGLFADP